jgi:hypothetical protein
VEAVTFYGPRCSCVAANAKANSGRRDDNVGIFLVRANLMNIAVDIYGGLPGFSAIR